MPFSEIHMYLYIFTLLKISLYMIFTYVLLCKHFDVF